MGVYIDQLGTCEEMVGWWRYHLQHLQLKHEYEAVRQCPYMQRIGHLLGSRDACFMCNLMILDICWDMQESKLTSIRALIQGLLNHWSTDDGPFTHLRSLHPQKYHCDVWDRTSSDRCLSSNPMSFLVGVTYVWISSSCQPMFVLYRLDVWLDVGLPITCWLPLPFASSWPQWIDVSRWICWGICWNFTLAFVIILPNITRCSWWKGASQVFAREGSIGIVQGVYG